MRDLTHLRTRANACVACHQNVEPALLKAGHPTLIFELDGQAVSEPRHWRETTNWHGAQAWLVGQAVALREMSWQLETASSPDEAILARWQGLRWLLEQAGRAVPALDTLAARHGDGTAPGFPHVRQLSDQLAQKAADGSWPTEFTEKILRHLASTSGAFADEKDAVLVQAGRAERLVLALDRLLADGGAADATAADQRLNALFKAVQAPSDFDPNRFAALLKEFERGLK
jgi:hypothetical protein